MIRFVKSKNITKNNRGRKRKKRKKKKEKTL